MTAGTIFSLLIFLALLDPSSDLETAFIIICSDIKTSYKKTALKDSSLESLLIHSDIIGAIDMTRILLHF